MLDSTLLTNSHLVRREKNVHNFSPRIKTKNPRDKKKNRERERERKEETRTKRKEETKKNDTKMKHPQIITYKKLGEELF